MGTAQGDDPIHLTGQPQIFERIAGQGAAHGMAYQIGFLRPGQGQDAVYMIRHLLGQFARVDVGWGITHRIHIGPAATAQPPLQPEKIGAVATVPMDQNDRFLPLLTGALRRRVLDQPQWIAEHQHRQTDGLPRHRQ